MFPCKPEQWKDLGPDYVKIFFDRNLYEGFCPNNTTPYKLKKTLSQ